MIYGNIEGIRNTIIEDLKTLYDIKLPREVIVTPEVAKKICFISSKIEREISIAVDRKGKISYVSIGDSNTVEVPVINIKEKKLSGIRIIHTHPNGNSRLSALDTSALVKLKLDCIVALGIENGVFENASIGFCTVENNVLGFETIENVSLEQLEQYDYLDKILILERDILEYDVEEDTSEKAILVGCDTEESLEELAELAKACEVKVVYKVFQNRNKIDSAYYIGSGKANEVAMLCQAIKANVVIFDDELSGSQVRNLEETIGVKVIDRTTLILEIFARRARSRDAKIQVELAQLKYRFTRLMGLGTVLSRTGGGIGTRGPGEKKLETDRRHIKERIYDLQDELAKIKKIREVQREKRNKESVSKISLVGYTNAGKSTLRNKLCDIVPVKNAVIKEKVFEANMLFATLDTTTRAIALPDGRIGTLTDTVGFIRKLPHDLVEAFKSTLEEVILSDLLVHVVDGASDYAVEQINAVEDVLNELNAGNIPAILAINKVDTAEDNILTSLKEYIYSNKKDVYTEIIEISALEGFNLNRLMELCSSSLPYKLKEVQYIIPYNEQAIVAYLHRNANIIEEDYRDQGTYIKAQVDDEVYNKTTNFLV
jgi:GTPase